MEKHPPVQTQNPAFVCPFCGLLCDDIPAADGAEIQPWTTRLQTSCPRAAAGLTAVAQGQMHPSVNGQAVSHDAALQAALDHLKRARRPVLGGLASDVQAQRAALALADTIHGRIVHCNQALVQRNLFPLQGGGAVTTTLAEIRHRATMVVFLGGDPTELFPRILTRLFPEQPAFIEDGCRELVWLHTQAPAADALAGLPAGVSVTHIDVGGLDIFDGVAALRALASDPQHPALQTLPPDLQSLARRMASCRYGALLWCAPQLPARHADVLVEALHQWMLSLNKTTRWAALPLAGSLGETGANASATWQTGFALPIDFTPIGPAYDPFPDYADADLVIWLASVPGTGPARLPGADPGIPLIHVGSAAPTTALPAQHVVLPAAVPAVHASGHFFRTDGVIALYAAAQVPRSLPTAASILHALADSLGNGGSV